LSGPGSYGSAFPAFCRAADVLRLGAAVAAATVHKGAP